MNKLQHRKKPSVPTASISKSVDRFADTAKSKNSNNNGVLNSKILIKNKLSSLKSQSPNLNVKENGSKPDALAHNGESDKKENHQVA